MSIKEIENNQDETSLAAELNRELLINAQTARENIIKYQNRCKKVEKERLNKLINKVFNIIKEESNKGKDYVGLRLSIMNSSDWEYILPLLDDLGYTYEFGGGGDIVSPYIIISWN